jgi:hypothetical protein
MAVAEHAASGPSGASGGSSPAAALLSGEFRWTASPPLVSPADRPADPCVSIKDPTIVRYKDRWHLFCTIRSKVRTHQIEYLSFGDWPEANGAERHVLKMHPGYFCAPQVFHFTPHKKWYLIYQASDESWDPKFQPVFSSTANLEDPASWTPPQPLYEKAPKDQKWIDFWVICDERKAYLFFTSLDGNLWRSEAALADFPHGWSRPVLALHADIFEAGHIYRLKGLNQYLAVIEAQHGGGRYYKAYVADRLDGAWQPLAPTFDKPFAGPANVRDEGAHWTDSISHGELLRTGFDERLEVDPRNLVFLFQGVSKERMAGKPYGEIPWQLGLLKGQK